MSRVHVSALPKVLGLSLMVSTAPAQLSVPAAGRTQQGNIHERDGIAVCQTSGGGTRAKANCEIEQTTIRQELTLSIELPALPSTQCEATSATEYQQRNAIARVVSTIKVADCAAASGAFTVAMRIRDESGETKPLELGERWQRSDDQDVKHTADYPIGENVDLLSVRVRELTCTCADPPAPEAAATPQE